MADLLLSPGKEQGQDVQAQFPVTTQVKGEENLSHPSVHVQQFLHLPRRAGVQEGRDQHGAGLGAMGRITVAHSERFPRLIEERMVV